MVKKGFPGKTFVWDGFFIVVIFLSAGEPTHISGGEKNQKSLLSDHAKYHWLRIQHCVDMVYYLWVYEPA